MPIYCFRRPDGGIVEEFFHYAEKPSEYRCSDGVVAVRDMRAEHDRRRRQGGRMVWPLLSRACGIHPSQIDEARRKNPEHEFTPDGRMVFRSAQHRKKCLRDLQMVDLDGFDSGRNI